MKSCLKLQCALLCLAVSLVSHTASADEFLDEIIVTADYRDRTAAELPASVTIVDSETIVTGAVQHFEELIGIIPNLNWSGDGNRARYLQIRGVGELEQYEGAPNPSVGFIIDDIDFSGIGAVATLFDLERIEILRGPQGTRYGANALAGLVYARTADPSGDWEGRVRVTTGEDALAAGGFALGGPLGLGTSRFRLSAHHHQSDGFRNNPFLGRSDTNGREETAVRGKLHWEAGDRWAFQAAALFSKLDNGYDAFALDNGFQVLSDRPGQDAQESLGASLRASWAGSRFDVTSITSVADSDIDFSFDADWGNPESWAPFTYDFISATYRKRQTVSQELRVSSSEESDTPSWVAGVYALDLQETLETRNQGVYDDPVVFFFSDALDTRFSSRFDALSLAGFIQLGLPVSNQGELSVGLRVENRSADYVDSDNLDVTPDETMWGGEIAYRHNISDGASAYVSASRGYKAGGFNLGLVPDGRREFTDEVLWSVEVGAKTQWLDDRLAVNLALFFNRREDQQVRTSFQLNPNDPASFVFFTDNAARGETLGLEGDVDWQITEALGVFGSIGVLDATFDRFVTPDVDLSGRDQAHAPSYTLNLGARFEHPSGVFARFDWIARDEFFFDVSHDQESRPYELANLRIGYRSERWTASLWARNLFDKRYSVRGFFFGNEPPDFPSRLFLRRGDPRQLGLTVDYQF